MLSDLRDSGSIEQDADVVMFIYRDDYYNPDTSGGPTSPGQRRQNRNGPTGAIDLFGTASWLPSATSTGRR